MLNLQERQAIIDTSIAAQYSILPPAQIVHILVDEEIYLSSESSFYRVLNDVKQLNHRGRSQALKRQHKPMSFTASGPNEVWSWDRVP